MADYTLVIVKDSYIYTGNTTVLTPLLLLGDIGSYLQTGNDATLSKDFPIAVGSYLQTGNDYTIIKDYVFSATQDSYIVTGTTKDPIGFKHSVLSIDISSYLQTPKVLGLIHTYPSKYFVNIPNGLIDVLDSANQKYDNSTSGLSATFSQDAIDELRSLLYVYITQTSTYTANMMEFIYVDTTGGAFTITLPILPIPNQKIAILDVATSFNTENLTINPNGSTIMGSGSNLVLSADNVLTEMIYTGTDWRIL